MALTFPLSAATFFDLVPVASMRTELVHLQSRTSASGQTFYADRGPARWDVDVTTTPITHADAARLTALLNSLQGGLKHILAYPIDAAYPQADPTGSILGVSTPKIGTITDRLTVGYTDLPAAYQLKAGDYFSVLYDTSRRYLGQVVEFSTADGSGVIAPISIAPPLPDLITTGAAVSLVKPVAKFAAVPGTVFRSNVSALHSTIQFSLEQTNAK